eukprot:Rhum_TRINITY_DN23396_c0_g1::Rhum_TRINITY_DN23396_c0_g1_i1::g.177877::m.177877/K09510/DNAJB4; DnaJ homolog subfamily B member 4
MHSGGGNDAGEFYDVLGVSEDATEEEIRKQYKKLAMKWHPDRQRTEEAKEQASEEFKKISVAYETLSDAEKRAEYDAAGPDGYPPGFDGMHGDRDFGDMFSFFFQEEADFFRRPQRMQKETLWVTLDELYTGVVQVVRITKESVGYGRPIDIALEVTVEAGWKSGTKVTFHEEGVEFTIQQVSHDVFKRKDHDLAACLDVRKYGQEIVVPLVGGGTKTVRACPGESRFQGLGMPIRSKGRVVGKGDLVLTFQERGWWYVPLTPARIACAVCSVATALPVAIVFGVLVAAQRAHRKETEEVRNAHPFLFDTDSTLFLAL